MKRNGIFRDAINGNICGFKHSTVAEIAEIISEVYVMLKKMGLLIV